MSTRATYSFCDQTGKNITMYKHHDGYPEGGHQFIGKIFTYIPDDLKDIGNNSLATYMANLFYISNITDGYMCEANNRDSHADTEYHYDITAVDKYDWDDSKPIGEKTLLNCVYFYVDTFKRKDFGSDEWECLSVHPHNNVFATRYINRN